MNKARASGAPGGGAGRRRREAALRVGLRGRLDLLPDCAPGRQVLSEPGGPGVPVAGAVGHGLGLPHAGRGAGDRAG
eukprot:14359216-Heterocapsa_arctica.AAC.1